MNLLIAFAMVACLLATVGIYGVLSLTVGSLENEIAIRLALGAQRRDVLRLILSHGLRLAAVGVGLGLVIALALATGLKTYLFGVVPTDPFILIGMMVLVFAITLVTCWIPAWRAAGLDPVTALKTV
jgi:ABC-type lipoprotein release transport system permease subunit